MLPVSVPAPVESADDSSGNFGLYASFGQLQLLVICARVYLASVLCLSLPHMHQGSHTP